MEVKDFDSILVSYKNEINSLNKRLIVLEKDFLRLQNVISVLGLDYLDRIDKSKYNEVMERYAKK